MRIETKCVQSGYTPGNGEPRQIPIVQSTTFKYATSEAMGRLFDLEDSGYFYSRLQNPTCDAVAAKICDLEGGTAAMLTSSGQSANFYAVFNIAGNGGMSLPVGFGAQTGMPVGLQIIGPQFRDELILRVGAALESCCDMRGRIAPIEGGAR